MSRIVTTVVVLKRALGGVKGFDEFKLIKDYECPEFGDEDVVVKIEACALSKYDMKILDDLKILSDNPLPVGREISGIVSQVGKSVSRFRVNDEIAGIIPLDVSCAGCGNICVLSQHDIVKKPASVCHIDAAAIIGDAVKAYTALYYLAKISTGETILVCNGASSLGLTAIQLAQHIGAKVIATPGGCTSI